MSKQIWASNIFPFYPWPLNFVQRMKGGLGTAYPSRTPEFTLVVSGVHVAQSYLSVVVLSSFFWLLDYLSFCFPLLATPLVSYRKIEDNKGVIKLDVLIPLGNTVMGNEPDIVCSLHTDWQRLLWVATHLLTHAVNILYLYPNLGEYMKCEHMFLIHYQIKWKVIIFVMKLFIKITCKRK